MEFTIYRSSEAELIKGCVQRKREAQKRLYDQYAPAMYTLCCRYMKDTVAAEDVLVMAFAKILERIDQYKGQGSFEGWVRRVVINEALAHLRSQRHMFVVTDLEEAEITRSIPMTDHLQEEDLLNMVKQLPAGYRTVFNMYAIDGYSHKEIAEHLGITENTSKSQLSRARVFLQKLLSRQAEVPQINEHGIRTR